MRATWTGTIDHRALAGLAAALALGIAPSLLAGSAIYVDDDAPSEVGLGTSWDTAHRRLIDAIAAAEAADGGVTEIRVAQGIYLPEYDDGDPETDPDRTATFRMLNGVTIRGGYAGLDAGEGESQDDRDTSRFPTYLSGDLMQDDGPDFENTTDNSYHVVTALDVDDTAVLEGVIVTGGRADGPNFGPSPDSQDQGSGLNVYFATPIILDVIFERNWCLNHGTVNDHGTTALIGCTFRENHAEALGAGLYLHHDSGATVIDCYFHDNATPGHGGGMYIRSMAHPTIEQCTFERNAAETGGGIYVDTGANPSISYSQFTHNAAGTGGGVFTLHSETSFLENTFVENEANDGRGGGGVWNQGGSADVIGCVFIGNTGFNGGGLYNGEGYTALVADCTFIENVGINDDGGGLSNADAFPTIMDCEFIDNDVIGEIFVRGGGISNYITDSIITDCTFRGNSSLFGGGGIYNEFGNTTLVDCSFVENTTVNGGAGMFNFNHAIVTAINCEFIDNAAGGGFFAAGGGAYNEINTEPHFVDCLFTGNTAEHGGGAIINFTAHPRITNCTIVGNTSIDPGGAMFSFMSDPIVTNTIMWGNVPDEIVDDVKSEPTVISHSIVAGGFASEDGTVHDVDPMFEDPSAGDYRLAAGSPAIDAGNNAAVPGRGRRRSRRQPALRR